MHIYTACTPRAFTNAIRQIGRLPPKLVSNQSWRAASTKHSKGFVAPGNEELAELRERVQEFTSTLAMPMDGEALLMSASRARNTRGSCCEDRPAK